MNPGDIVRSTMGRDKGHYFIVVATDEQFAYLADGDIRKADTPKKKKLKHMAHTGKSDGFIAKKLEQGMRPTNSELRKAVANLPYEEEA